MGTGTFSDDFKRDAVAQITERGYPVSEVSERLGVSKHSLYAWKRKFGKSASGENEKDAEIRMLKRELARVSEERDILKKGEPCPPLVRGQWRARISPGMQSEIRVRGRASGSVFGAGDVPVPAYPAERLLCLAEDTAEPAGVRQDRRQTELLHKAWAESGKVYGYRKLHDDLIEQGESICPRPALPGWRNWRGSRRRSAISGAPAAMAASRRSWSITLWTGSSISMRQTRFG